MADERDRERKIKVVDKRWFNDRGELREDRPVEPARPAGEPSPPPPEEPRRQGPEERFAEAPEGVQFLDLVDFLAQQAVLLLRGAQGVPRSPQQARIFIDFLGVLERTTSGNLRADEARELENVLYQLRTLYVQAGG